MEKKKKKEKGLRWEKTLRAWGILTLAGLFVSLFIYNPDARTIKVKTPGRILLTSCLTAAVVAALICVGYQLLHRFWFPDMQMPIKTILMICVGALLAIGIGRSIIAYFEQKR